MQFKETNFKNSSSLVQTVDIFETHISLSNTILFIADAFLVKALYTYGVVDYLLRTLMGNVQANMYEISCHGIGMMTLYNPAAKELTASNCVKHVLGRLKKSIFLKSIRSTIIHDIVPDVLKNENLKFSARQAALFALNQLLKCDVKNCQELLDIHGQVILCVQVANCLL